jgi:hypothetical protein
MPSQSLKTLAVCLAQEGRRCDWQGSAVEAHREGRHAQLAAGIPHELDDTALSCARFSPRVGIPQAIPLE